MKTGDTLRQVANVVAIPLGVAMNFVVPAIVGIDVDEGTAKTALSAAGYAFGIWSIIFLAQLVYAVYQAQPSQRENPILRRVGWLTAINGLANAVIGGLWAVDSTAGTIVGWLMILVLLASLIPIEAGFAKGEPRGGDFWRVRVPFSLNLGWVSVATLISTAQVLQNVAGWNGTPLTAQTWAALLVAIAAGLGVTMVALRDNYAYGAVILWGLIGVAAEGANAPLVSTSANVTAGLVALVLAATAIARRTRRNVASTAA